MRNKIIKYLNFYNGSNNYKVKTDIRDASISGVQTSTVIGNISGLLTPGENVSDVVQRSYSDGAVLDPNPIFSYKDISVEFLFYGKTNATVKTAYNNFINFMKTSNSTFTLTSDYPTTNIVQFQRVNIERESWKENGGGFIVVTAYYASKEAW